MKKFTLLLLGALFIVSAGFSYAATKDNGKCGCNKVCPDVCACGACSCAR